MSESNDNYMTVSSNMPIEITLGPIEFDLQPCPFCGGQASVIPDNSYGSCIITCNDEYCFGYGHHFAKSDMWQMIWAWNKRTVQKRANVKIEKVQPL